MKSLWDRIKSITRKNPGGVMVLGIFVVAFSVFLIGSAFAALTPVKSVIITSQKTSYEEKDPGSWQVEKSGKWIDKGKAEVTFDVTSTLMKNSEYTDVIFVLDISGSMEGSKINYVKSDMRELLDTLLENKGNRAGVISFSNDSQILLGLTNNKNNLNDVIDSLEVTGDTNYYQALVDVEELLKGYKKENNRDLVVLFLTDGYPNIDSPNEVTQYAYLKENYPYAIFNGVQYEMGDIILDPIKKISDNQFIADMDSLHNVLYDAALPPKEYDEFQIIDYINNDYFTLKSVDDIEVSQGNVKLEKENNKQKIIWNLDNLKSGSEDIKLTMKLDLKDEYLGTGGIYPTNNSEEVISKIEGNSDEDVVSTKTPILSEKYRVTYDGNAPAGCSISDVPSSEDYLVFDTVSLSTKELSCVGYKFNGWEITNKGITKIGDDHFIMPEEDVVIKAKWSKLDISKTMDGNVSQIMSLYDIMAKQSVMDNVRSTYVLSFSGINFGYNSSNTNGKGVYERAGTENDEYPIYYYRGNVNNNHVKFANFCWKAVRTTNTGGVKLIYDGVPDENGYCNNTGEATQIGSSAFNSIYSSPVYAGYMYGTTKYVYSWRSMKWTYLFNREVLTKWNMSDTNYYYSDSVTYENGVYTLNDPKQYNYSDYSDELEGVYTCFSETESTCTAVGYVDSAYNDYIYYVSMVDGEMYESLVENSKKIKWKYGNDVRWDGEKYTLIDTVEGSPIEWLDGTRGLVENAHRYTCFSTENKCDPIYYITDSSSSFSYDLYYMTLNDGKKIDIIFNEMFPENNDLRNQTDSDIKNKIDEWYASSMIDYTQNLEDTVWCNNRTPVQINTWNKDYIGLRDMVFSDRAVNLVCPSIYDSFTVSSENGNGKLTYPVGLLTLSEAIMAGASTGGELNYYLNTGRSQWLMSVSSCDRGNIYGKSINAPGEIGNSYVVGSKYDVRPAISLANYMLVVRGDGSSEHPYEVMSEEELYG